MSLLIVSTAVALVVCGACGPTNPHTVSGKTSSEVFEDEALRRVADAACRGDAARVSRHVDDGADVNGQGLDGLTPLIWALTCESHAGMRALLDAGADPNQRVRDNRGENAVIYAATYFDETLLALLLEYGGDPNSHTLSTNPRFALLEAFRMGDRNDDWDTYRLLQEAGALPTIPESAGVRPVQTVIDLQIVRNRLCEAADYIEQGFLPESASNISNLALLHNDSNDEEACRRTLIDRIEAELTDEQVGNYWNWLDRHGEPVSYSGILNP